MLLLASGLVKEIIIMRKQTDQCVAVSALRKSRLSRDLSRENATLALKFTPGGLAGLWV